jgi:Caspase recruitment domain
MDSYKLRKNESELLQRLEIDDDQIETMKSQSCFTQQQVTSIHKVSNLQERNKKLLDILSRRSVENFKRFVECLRATQPDIEPLLTGSKGKQLVNQCIPQVVALKLRHLNSGCFLP